MQVSKWGNTLAVRLPATVIDALELKEGDDIEIRVAEPRVFAISKKAEIARPWERLRAFRGRLPENFTFDRDEANERG